MSGKYAAGTTVPADRTRAEIERTLTRYGATAFSYGWDQDRAVIMFQAEGRRIRFDIPVPALEEFEHTPTGRWRPLTQRQAAQEQAVKQRWRALALVVKAKLEAVAAGVFTFEEEFLAHVMLPDGSKVADWMAPQLQAVYEDGRMPELLPPARRALEAGR